MTTVAAVDCGTNSIRLLVSDITHGKQTDLHREMRIVRLGQGVDRTGRLAAEALQRTRAALQDYRRTCERIGVDRSRMVATSATRDAANRDEFTSMVREILQVEPEIVTGEEEAALSFLGATRGLDQQQGPFLVMDIGGGSTELVLGSDAVTAAHSMDVGCVRLTERHLQSDPPTPEQVEAAERDIDAALEQARAVVPVAEARTAVGLAGSVTTVAAIALGLSTYDPRLIHGSRIGADSVHRVADRLLSMTLAQRLALPVMHPGRVDVIGAGALILRTLVDRLALGEVLVSEADILDGIAWSIA
jgi:exopolyphosphatase/guanosine-5'-triphosphate,3'-diphosphate pyrophosphatase